MNSERCDQTTKEIVDTDKQEFSKFSAAK